MTLRAIPAALLSVMMAIAPLSAQAQTEEDATEQMLAQLDAMIIGPQVTTRCAFYDDTIDYLSPLESVAVDIRRRETEMALSPIVNDLADRVSTMISEANAIQCGEPGLVPFLDFNRQIAGDVTDIAIVAWQDIAIEQCAYFADEDFMAAVGRAKAAQANVDAATAPDRAAYITSRAQAWVSVFAENCGNLGFQPAQTLPGLIALALPHS